MTPEEAVAARLEAIGAVTSLVSTRIYMLKLPQGPTLPAIRVQLIDDIKPYHLRGGTRCSRARIQVDAYADEASGGDPYASASEVAEAIHGDDTGSGLSGWTGSIGSPAFEVLGIFRLDRDASYDPDHLRLVRMRQDYAVHFRG